MHAMLEPYVVSVTLALLLQSSKAAGNSLAQPLRSQRALHIEPHSNSPAECDPAPGDCNPWLDLSHCGTSENSSPMPVMTVASPAAQGRRRDAGVPGSTAAGLLKAQLHHATH
jgi:hypothetical protein